MMEVYHILFVGNQDDYDCDVSRQSGWAVIQAITELAEALYSFIPGSAYPYSKPKVDFGTVANDVGLGNLWPGGSKRPAIQTLLEDALRTRRDRFCSLSVGFKIPELVDPNFISSLPKAEFNQRKKRGGGFKQNLA